MSLTGFCSIKFVWDWITSVCVIACAKLDSFLDMKKWWAGVSSSSSGASFTKYYRCSLRIGSVSASSWLKSRISESAPTLISGNFSSSLHVSVRLPVSVEVRVEARAETLRILLRLGTDITSVGCFLIIIEVSGSKSLVALPGVCVNFFANPFVGVFDW